MRRTVQLWNLISYIGVNSSVRFGRAKPVVLTNQVSFLTSLVCLAIFFNYWFHDLYLVAFVQIVSVGCFISPLFLNYFQKFRAAKVVLFLSANLSIFLTSSLLGYESAEHYAYFPLIIGLFILFDKEEKHFIWFFTLLSCFLLAVLEITDYSLLLINYIPGHILGLLSVVNIFATVVLILICINYFRSISEQHIDSIIKKTYEELNAIFNNAHDAILILDPHTHIITECNDRALAIFHYQKRSDIIGKPFVSLQKEPADSPHIDEIHQNIISSKSWMSDEKYITQDGREFWGNLAITSVELEDKNILVARITDITEKKQISILLENLAHDLKKVQNIVKLGYWHLDVNTYRITYFSEEARTQFSLPVKLEEIPFDRFVASVYQKDLPRLTSAIEESLAQRMPFELEFRVTTTQEARWIYIKSDLIIDDEGQVSKIICTSLDITERKIAEEKLKASERNYRKLASNLPDTDVFLFDQHLRIILAEGTIMQKHGLNSNFFEGKIVDDIIDPTYKDYIKPLYEAVLKGEQVSSDIAFNNDFLNMRGVPLRDANNAVSGGLIVSQDITSRKRNEQELIKAKEEAEKASKAKALFLSTMSHELRTPLNAVIGIAHLLLQESPRPDQAENLQVLHFSAENLLVLINDVLDFSKIEAGKVEFEEIEFKVHDLLNSTIQLLKFRAEEKKLKLTLKISEEVPEAVIGDPTKLSQVMNNLISNAIKFTEAGSVSVVVRVHEKNEEHITLFFSVEDTGVGIPEEKIETVFEQFSQADSNTTRKFGGTGLGLTITKKILELQGSKINVTSKVGDGSIFSFSLTFKVSHEAEVVVKDTLSSNASQVEKEDTHAISVLLVEDNPTNVLIATKFLQKWNLNCDHAENGQIAVEKATTQDYDLILMDLQMPVMDGYQAAAEIRKYDQTTPIIALTASATLETKIKIEQAGMNEIITKPFNPADLYQKIIKWAKLNNEIKS